MKESEFQYLFSDTNTTDIVSSEGKKTMETLPVNESGIEGFGVTSQTEASSDQKFFQKPPTVNNNIIEKIRRKCYG